MSEPPAIRVARITAELWRVESSAPTERGPYAVIWLGDDQAAACECVAGRFEADCVHRQVVRLAAAGHYPVSRLQDITGPGADARMPPRLRERVAAHNRHSRQRVAAATITDDDYALFGEEKR